MNKRAYGYGDEKALIERLDPLYHGKDRPKWLTGAPLKTTAEKAAMLAYLRKYSDHLSDKGYNVEFSNERWGHHQGIDDLEEAVNKAKEYDPVWSQYITRKRKLFGLLDGGDLDWGKGEDNEDFEDEEGNYETPPVYKDMEEAAAAAASLDKAARSTNMNIEAYLEGYFSKVIG